MGKEAGIVGEASRNMTKKEQLIEAIKQGNLEKVKELGENEVDLHFSHERPLVVASARGHIEIVKYLVDKGCSVKDSASLHLASSNGMMEVVKYLVEQGADKNGKLHIEDTYPSESYTVMQLANKHGRFEVVAYLRSKILLEKLEGI